MPALHLGFMIAGVNAGYNFYKGAYISAEARTSMLEVGMDIFNIDMFIPLYSTKSLMKSGRLLVGEKTELYSKRRYFVEFGGVTRNINVGLVFGLTRFNSPNYEYHIFENQDLSVGDFKVVSLNCYEAGIGLHFRYGIAISTFNRTVINFRDNKLTAKVSYCSSQKVQYGGEHLRKGDIPANSPVASSELFKSEVGFQFGWNAILGRSSKERSSKLVGDYFIIPCVHFQVRYIPLLTSKQFLYMAGIGFAFALKPRYYTSELDTKQSVQNRPIPQNPRVSQGKTERSTKVNTE